MRENHMVGLSPVIAADWDLVKAAGVRWLRVGAGFPFKDRAGGERSPGFERNLERARQLRQRGFRLMGSTMSPGVMRYDPQQKKTAWASGLPAWAGEVGSEEYYTTLERACEEMARQAAGIVDVWQVANEPDIEIFRGPLTDEQVVRFLLASGRGIRKGNRYARVGINLGFMTDYSRRLLEKTYAMVDTPFDYIGLDGYFGSWQDGGPENWPAYIDEAHRRTGKPVIINEWGYSSLGSAPKTDDPERKKRYNQGVCREQAWKRVWRKAHSPEEQAEYIRACVRIFAGHPKVMGNFLFRWSDTATCWQCGEPDCPAECAWGIVDVHQKPKPGYFALKEAVGECFPPQ